MEPYGVSAVEQPVAKGDTGGLKEVSARSKALIVADESVCTLGEAQKLIEAQGCHVFNIRISKCGGLIASMAIFHLARRAGMRCQIGCQAGETGILSAAGRHLAGWLGDILYLEGSFGSWVLQEDIVDEDIRFGKGGQAPPIVGRGLGVHVNREALDKHTIRRETLSC
jgi:muconate cycloisomerase